MNRGLEKQCDTRGNSFLNIYIYIYEIVGWWKTILSPMGNVGNKYGGSWKGLVRIFQLCHTEVAFSSVTIAGFVADIDLVN